MDQIKLNNTVYSAQDFLEVDVAVWGNRLKDHIRSCMNEEAGYSQRKAWLDCFNILRREIPLLGLSSETLDGLQLVFEYELPRERGRRPDVLFLSGQNLIVLEFKGFAEEDQAHLDQAKHYARDLSNYHLQSHNLNVIPILVLVGASNVLRKVDGVQVVSGERLHELLGDFKLTRFADIEAWFNSEYAPLPSLIRSAQMLFKEKSFPQIKKAQSAGIPETINKLKAIAAQAEENGSHHLALITGVPGAGKTLVGLQFVHEIDMVDNRQKAVFLSGNGPLVKVLQFSLGTRHMVKGVHDFLKQYSTSTQVPSEDIMIYDEAQRAWDAEKASSHRANSNSEPVDFLNVGGKKSYCLMIGLIGEGQEIHLGEESGMKLWSEALNQSLIEWKLHCPGKLGHHFDNFDTEAVDAFNLTTSLRTHQALTLQRWVECTLENQLVEAKELSESLFEEGYPIYLTRDFNAAKEYAYEKYADEPDKTYGVIASSKSMVLPKYGINNDFNSTRNVQVARYYVDTEYAKHCRKLNSVVTEFACQGLELDQPILAWDADWIYENRWIDKRPNRKAKDSFNLRKNSYRVLLTRGRDGLIIFVPPEKSLNNTYHFLKTAGCRVL